MKHTEVTADGHKKTRRTRRIAVVSAAALAVAVGGGVAYAYWTAGGTGNGSATTGNVQGITINQTSAITGLYPGGNPVALAGTFTNGNSGPVYVAQVTVAVDPSWEAQADGNKPACTAGDFSLVQPAATNGEVVTGTTWSGASIQLVDSATNQDNCKGVNVPLVYSSN